MNCLIWRPKSVHKRGSALILIQFRSTKRALLSNARDQRRLFVDSLSKTLTQSGVTSSTLPKWFWSGTFKAITSNEREQCAIGRYSWQSLFSEESSAVLRTILGLLRLRSQSSTSYRIICESGPSVIRWVWSGDLSKDLEQFRTVSTDFWPVRSCFVEKRKSL